MQLRILTLPRLTQKLDRNSFTDTKASMNLGFKYLDIVWIFINRLKCYPAIDFFVLFQSMWHPMEWHLI